MIEMTVSAPATIQKRDGRVVPFDIERIEGAFTKCFAAFGREPATPVDELARRVVNIVAAKSEGSVPTVEGVQDIAEMVLQAAGEFEAAKRYILYRAEHARLRDERPVPPDVAAAFDADAPYFPTPLQRFQFMDKYSRWNGDLGRRETWVETVDRAVAFLRELAAPYADLGDAVYDRIRDGILTMRVMPSMRLLAMAGTPARRDNTTIFNCSYQGVDSLDAFVEALLISMAGCGVGYSVERQYVDLLPSVDRQRGGAPDLWVVQDSAEGWGDALRVGLEAWFSGADVVYDYSVVRPQGAVLATKGGRASGPEPLKRTLDFVRARILARQGRRLRPIDAHDIMCAVGNAAVSGGVRRTAMISLFDADDADMLLAKTGDFERENSQRWNANNSAVWQNVATMDQQAFLEQFMAMVRSGNGEPGIFNREMSAAMRPDRRAEAVFGTNPCFGAGTLVQTRDGHFPIESLIGKEVEIWNGTDWQAVDNFRVTSENEPMLKITLHDGSLMRATLYHSFILEDGTRLPARDLAPGMKLMRSVAPITHGTASEPGAYLKGFLLADGTHIDDRPALFLYEPKYGCAERLVASAREIEAGTLRTTAKSDPGFVPAGENRLSMHGIACRKEDLLAWATDYKSGLPDRVFAWDFTSKIQFLSGLFDGDGTASDTKNGFLYQLSSVNRDFLLDVQALLKTIGVRSHLGLMKAAGTCDFNDGYGPYDSRACWRLTISQVGAVELARNCVFSRLASFAEKRVKYTVKPRFNTVASVEQDGVDEKVYCCTVEGSHSFALTNGLHIGQCGEITLRPNQFCNLSAAVVRATDTPADLYEKVELAAIIGTIQSLATNFPHLRPIWKRNTEEERLLGVDITGQLDNPKLLKASVLAHAKQRVIETNREYAARLGVNQSAATTCVKPSGNTSVLVDCSSGLHARWAPYYIRNVRVSASSPLAKVLKDAGAPMNPENGDDPQTPRTWVVSFPVKAPDGAITRNDRSAVEQCNWWLRNKIHWTEHNPSVTITYKPDEIIGLMSWVWDHREKIGGMSFLPSFDAKYDQLPYIEIRREEYERRAAEFPSIDWSKVWRYEQDDRSSAAQTVACEGLTCVVE